MSLTVTLLKNYSIEFVTYRPLLDYFLHKLIINAVYLYYQMPLTKSFSPFSLYIPSNALFHF